MKEHYASSFLFGTPAKGASVAVSRMKQRFGFTLTEVVLAVGVLSLAIVALLGLFGPTMGSVKNVIDRSGALSVADQLNAKLMSGEIYTVYDIQNQADPFGALADQLLTTNDGTFSNTKRPLIAWRQYDRHEDAANRDMSRLSLKMSANYNDIDGIDLSLLDGAPYMVFLSQGLQQTGSGNYKFSEVDQSAYFPIAVSIYEIPPTVLLGTGTRRARLMGLNLAEYRSGVAGQPLFQYTTAKLR